MKWADTAFKILAILVIPLLGWGIRLEVSNAVLAEKVAHLEQEVAAASSIRDGVAANRELLGRMEEKLSSANANLTEIKGLVHALGKTP